MKIWMLATTLAISCGTGTAYIPCDLDCSKIQSASALNCRVAIHNVNMVVQGMAENGIATQREACRILQEDVTITVRTQSYGWVEDGAHYGGMYRYCEPKDPGCIPGIEVTRTMNSLAHEALHAYQDRHGLANRDDPHAGWHDNRAIQAFLKQYEEGRQCGVDVWDNTTKPSCWAEF